MGEVRYTHSFCHPRSGNSYDLEIYDKTYSAGESTTEIDGDSVQIVFEGESAEYDKALFGSRCEFTYHVKTAAHRTFINNIAEAAEGTYLMRIKRGSNLVWVGVILPDMIEIPDTTPTQLVRIVATDGIERLKDVDSASAGTGSKTFIEIMIAELEQIDSVAEFYDTSDLLLRTIINIYEGTHGTITAALDPADKTRTDTEVFYKFAKSAEGSYEYELDDDGNRVKMSAYDVLEQVVSLFEAELHHFEGYFRVKSKNAAYTENYRYREYDIDGTMLDSDTESDEDTIDQVDVKIAATAFTRLLPSLNKVTLD